MDPCNFLASRSLKNQRAARRQSETVEAFYQEHGSSLFVALAQWWSKRKQAKPDNSEKAHDLGAFALMRRRKVT